jgi:hypothetical protein
MKTYIDMIKSLLDENKTTGENHSEAMLHYTNMNVKRLERWLTKGVILDETVATVKQINKKQNWTVLTEAWCGDAAHSIGFIQKMADLNPNIDLQWKLRDENLDIMDQYLTNGGRSIPKLIARDEDGTDLFDWGPRPSHIQDIYLDLRKKEVPYSEISIELQKLYNKDKGITIQQEIIAKINATL